MNQAANQNEPSAIGWWRNPAHQATLLSLLVTLGITAVLFFALVGHRDTRIGQYMAGGLFALGLVALIFARPQWGTYLLTITIFTGLSNAFTERGLPSINKPLVAITFVSLLITIVFHRRSFPQPKRIELFMLASGVAWIVSAFLAYDQSAAFEQITDFVKDYIIVLCIIISLSAWSYWQRALWLLILSAGFVSALTTYQVVTGNFTQTFGGLAHNNIDQVISEVYQVRVSGPVGDPNFYGLILIAPLALALYRAMDERQLSLRLLAVVAAGFILFAILNTYSRGAFVALVVVLVLIAFERRVKPKFLLVTAVALFFTVQILPPAYQDRLASLVNLKPSDQGAIRSETSFKGRYSELLAGAQMFADHPFVGVGINNYPGRYQEYAGRIGLEYRTTEREAHSFYVEVAAETGLLGIFAFSGLFFISLYDLGRAKRKLAQANADPHWQSWLTSLQVALVGYMACTLFLHDAYIRYLWLLIGFCAAAVHIVDSTINSNHNNPHRDRSNVQRP
jgi:putative inorganic carbon (hco3(-)) transporter